MGEFDIFGYLADNGPFALFGGLIIWYLINQLKKKEDKIDELESEIREQSKFQIDLLKDSQSLLTLVNDKLTNDRNINQIIEEINAIVKRIAADVQNFKG